MFWDIAGAVKGAKRRRMFLKTQGVEKAVDDSWRTFEMAVFMSREQRVTRSDRPACGGGGARRILITI